MKSFIDLFVDYYKMRSDGDPIFAKVGACQLLGHILGHESFVDVTPNGEYFNIYALFVSGSFLGRKNVAQDIIKSFFPCDVILPDETSPEQFIKNLSETPNGVWFYGEFSKLMKDINKNNYLSGIAETMNNLYNYRGVYKRKLVKGEWVINNPYPVFNSTLTPGMLESHVTPEMMEGGLFGRLFIVPGVPSDGKKGRTKIPKKSYDVFNKLKSIVDLLYERSNKYVFSFDDDALKRLNEIEIELANSEACAVAGRYGQTIIKLSGIIRFSKFIGMCVQTIDDKKEYNLTFKHQLNQVFYTVPKEITIKSSDLDEAYRIVIPCIEYVFTLNDYSMMQQKHIIKIREYIKKKQPVKRSIVMKNCHVTAKQIHEAETTLQEYDVLKVVCEKKGNRMEKIYSIKKGR